MSLKNTLLSRYTPRLALFGVLLGLGLALGCQQPLPTVPAPPPPPPKPKACPLVLQLVQTVSVNSPEGRDLTLLRFFLANREQLTSLDIDCIIANTADPVVRGFISAEFYGKALIVKEVEEKR
jgi:hypothetical protein